MLLEKMSRQKRTSKGKQKGEKDKRENREEARRETARGRRENDEKGGGKEAKRQERRGKTRKDENGGGNEAKREERREKRTRNRKNGRRCKKALETQTPFYKTRKGSTKERGKMARTWFAGSSSSPRVGMASRMARIDWTVLLTIISRKASRSSVVNPLSWMSFICFRIVLFPESPAPAHADH